MLATLNAKYIHAALGLRYLLANMGGLRSATVMCEFTVASAAQDVVDALLLALDAPDRADGAAADRRLRRLCLERRADARRVASAARGATGDPRGARRTRGQP